jgi:cytidylate kinase
MVGRDIGTNVLKNASHKFYLEASPIIRAQRRFEELTVSSEITLNQVLDDIKHRDTLDSTRLHAPLKKASDALLINTDDLNIDQTASIILKSIKWH